MIGIYTRVSTNQQNTDDKTSIEQQIINGLDFAQSKNETYKIYTDTYSGELEDRPSFLDLKRDIQNKIINIVWIDKVDRLSRSTVVSLQFRDFLKNNNVPLYERGERVDFSDINKNMFFEIQSSFAQAEKARILERMYGGLQSKELKGYRVFAKCYGYNYSFDSKGNREISINESEAEIIREIFTRVINQEPYRQIAIDLSNRFPLYSWTAIKIKRIIEKKIYTGYYDMRITKRKEKLSQRVYNNKIHSEYKTLDMVKDIKSHYYEPIIDSKIYQKAQKVAERAILRATNLNVVRSNYHIGSSLIKCAYCGQSITYSNSIRFNKTLNKKYRYEYYKTFHKKDCNKKPNATYVMAYPYVDFWLIQEALDFLADEKSLMKLYRKEQAEFKQKSELENKRLKELRNSADTLQKKKLRLIEMNMELDDIDIVHKIRDINDQANDIQKEIDRIERSLLHQDKKLTEVLAELTVNARIEFSKDSNFEKRKKLMKWTKSATVKDNTITLEWITGRISKVTFNNFKWWRSFTENLIKERNEKIHAEVRQQLPNSDIGDDDYQDLYSSLRRLYIGQYALINETDKKTNIEIYQAKLEEKELVNK